MRMGLSSRLMAYLAVCCGAAMAPGQQSIPHRPPADAPQRIEQALSQQWGRLPPRVDVSVDAAGYPWFTVADFDSFVESDGLMQEAAEAQLAQRWVPAPGLVPLWSDGQRLWCTRLNVAHLLRSYNRDLGQWQALHVNGLLIDEPQALKKHLQEIEARPSPRDFAGTEGQWLAAMPGSDGTMHLVSQDQSGVGFRSGRMDTARGVEQVAHWPVHAAPRGFEFRRTSGLLALPGGEVWAFIWPELGDDFQSLQRATPPSVWQYLPNRTPAWQPLAALNAELATLAADPASGSMGFLEVIPLPSGNESPASHAMVVNEIRGNLRMIVVPQPLDQAGVAMVARLIIELGDPEYQVRQQATEALSDMHEALPTLRERLPLEQDPERRARLEQVIVALQEGQPRANVLQVAGQQYRVRGGQVLATGARGVGAVVLLREVRELSPDGLVAGDEEADLLLTIPMRHSGGDPLEIMSMRPVAGEGEVEQPENPGSSKRYSIDPSPPAHWVAPGEIWLENGWLLQLQEGKWQPTSHVPAAVARLAFRAADREGRVYFGTSRFHGSENPVLSYWPEAPGDDDTEKSLRQPQHPPPTDAFMPFPGLGQFEAIPAAASAGAGKPSLEGAWGIRRGEQDGAGRLVLLAAGQVSAMPAVDLEPKLRMSYLIPLRGGAIVYEAGSRGRAALWDGQRWHTADDLPGLVHEHAAAMAAMAGNEAGMPARGSSYASDAILAGNGHGGLWFMQALPPDGEGRTEPVLHLEFFDGAGWHDLGRAFQAAVIDGEGTPWRGAQGPKSRYVIDGGSALVVQTPAPAAVYWHLSLDEDMAPRVRRMTPYDQSGVGLVPDGHGRLWSNAFGTRGTRISAWADGEPLGERSAPQPRTLIIRGGAATVHLPQGGDGIMDGAGRTWLFSWVGNNAGSSELEAHVRLLDSEQDALHPASARPPEREPSRSGIDLFGGSWASSGPLGVLSGQGDDGQQWTLDGEGRLWLLTAEGLSRLEIRPSPSFEGNFSMEQWIRMAPGPYVTVAERRPWPRPMTGARLVVPDRGGLWVVPVPNEFGQPQPSFYMPLAAGGD